MRYHSSHNIHTTTFPQKIFNNNYYGWNLLLASYSAWGWGDPHITTLDGRTYTFNGWGEYTLLEPASNTTQFVLQGRTSPVNESTSNSATQFSAYAFGVPEEVSFQVCD